MDDMRIFDLQFTYERNRVSREGEYVLLLFPIDQ